MNEWILSSIWMIWMWFIISIFSWVNIMTERPFNLFARDVEINLNRGSQLKIILFPPLISRFRQEHQLVAPFFFFWRPSSKASNPPECSYYASLSNLPQTNFFFVIFRVPPARRFDQLPLSGVRPSLRHLYLLRGRCRRRPRRWPRANGTGESSEMGQASLWGPEMG